MKSPPEKRRTAPRQGNAAPFAETHSQDTDSSDRFNQKSNQGPHVALEPGAIRAAEAVIHSWTEYGIHDGNEIAPEIMPTVALERIARAVITEAENGTRHWGNFTPLFMANEADRIAFIQCTQGTYPAEPPHCTRFLETLRTFYRVRETWRIGLALQGAENDGQRRELVKRLADLEEVTSGKTASMIVRGVNSYPTETPAEDVILGNGWMRRGDIATLISTAGSGKSVAVTQAGMCWGLGLSYLGIRPPRPLRIILFSGEDDGVTIGQCREGLLENSEAITGRKLTSADLDKLDDMMRTEFIREHVGLSFHGHLEKMLRQEAADLVIINPLLSYLGGEVVGCVSEFIRAGLMPILQAQDCAALIAHHTPKLAKDGWENTDDTYSGIGGAEIANIPRSILTLRPTPAQGISVVSVSKRQTTGWKDAEGNYSTKFFVQRTDNPERPAWIPVDHDLAEELIGDSKQTGSGKQTGRKGSPEKVAEIVAASRSEVARQDLIARTAALCECGNRTAQDAVKEAERVGMITAIEKPTGRGGKNAIFYRIADGNLNPSDQ
jgi:hypothetical protein